MPQIVGVTITAMDQRDFLAEILANPTAVEPRLVFADWLDENGDPRGEFIQVQCQLADLDLRDQRRIDLEYQLRDLWALYGDQWKSTATDGNKIENCKIENGEFTRGMIESVTMQSDHFLNHHESLLYRFPLQGVRLLDPMRSLKRVAACPSLSKLSSLNLQGGDILPGELKQFLQSPNLENLNHIGISIQGLGRNSIMLIARSETLPNLRSLSLSPTDADHRNLPALATSEVGRNLRRLSLRYSSIRDEELRSLAYKDVFPNLESLDLSENVVFFADAFQEFAGSPRFCKLHNLSMQNCRLERLDVAFLGGLRLPSEMRTLNLDTARLHAESAKNFAKSSLLHGLVELSASGCEMTDQGLIALLFAGDMPLLRTLKLCRNDFTDVAAKAIANWPESSHLTSLELSDNQIGDDGITAIAQSPHLANLNELNIGGNPISNHGIQALIQSETLSRITSLQINVDDPKLLEGLQDRFGSHAVNGIRRS